MPEITIAIAKGRLQTDALALFASAGICISGDAEESRRLSLHDESGCYRFIFVKPADVPVYVEHGIADAGVVGLDVLLESGADVLQPLTLDIGCCRIAVAGPDSQRNGYGVLRVATKYPQITARHFGSLGQPVEIIELCGSVELAPVLGLADCIVDLVETGATLRDNGLSVWQVIADSSARFVVNRASYQLKAKPIANLIAAIKTVSREAACD
jgi:ATP phosphoribosyltransferase